MGCCLSRARPFPSDILHHKREMSNGVIVDLTPPLTPRSSNRNQDEFHSINSERNKLKTESFDVNTTKLIIKQRPQHRRTAQELPRPSRPLKNVERTVLQRVPEESMSLIDTREISASSCSVERILIKRALKVLPSNCIEKSSASMIPSQELQQVSSHIKGAAVSLEGRVASSAKTQSNNSP